jgi:hypothetical protein
MIHKRNEGVRGNKRAGGVLRKTDGCIGKQTGRQKDIFFFYLDAMINEPEDCSFINFDMMVGKSIPTDAKDCKKWS